MSTIGFLDFPMPSFTVIDSFVGLDWVSRLAPASHLLSNEVPLPQVLAKDELTELVRITDANGQSRELLQRTLPDGRADLIAMSQRLEFSGWKSTLHRWLRRAPETRVFRALPVRDSNPPNFGFRLAQSPEGTALFGNYQSYPVLIGNYHGTLILGGETVIFPIGGAHRPGVTSTHLGPDEANAIIAGARISLLR